MQQLEATETTGVILLNLGGPESLDEVEPFLYNLFSDRRIIRLGPAFLQKTIARLIARRRAPKSRENYRKIGGGSPINRITADQAKSLEQRLRPDGRFMVRACMRYHPPLARQVLRQMTAAGVRRIIGLPLYPHYSIATTGSSFSDLHRAAGVIEPAPAIVEIRSWPREPLYINCLARRVREGLARFSGPVQVVYSAHSLPKKFIAEGDPYVRELETTIQALEEKTGQPGRLCYQSRSGPVEWLEPSTPDMLHRLADQGCENILMVPISFVSDHVETLYEIDMLYRDMAHEMGMRLESTRALNDDPEFIAALHDLVLNAASPPSTGSVPPNNKIEITK
ncbi:ferrochelatase [bacterium BMS3Bbin14]|nr:ferrochelatase [bacterium BMS3Bbin14]HDL97993.1 ferrochelatase [Desulfobacteraceae bacterium]HDZ76276.1 ferrochelatase [Desulfobacteraceae bacterium]